MIAIKTADGRLTRFSHLSLVNISSNPPDWRMQGNELQHFFISCRLHPAQDPGFFLVLTPSPAKPVRWLPRTFPNVKALSDTFPCIPGVG